MGLKLGPKTILFFSLFIVMAGFGIILPILPFFSIKLGANTTHVGFLMASYSLMQFIFSPIWGGLSDKYGRKPIILIGLFGFAVSFFLFGIADSILMLFLSRIAGGILSSACLPTSMAYIADVTDEKERGAGMGLMGAAMGLGIIVGPAIGSFFSTISYTAPFIAAAILALLNLIFAALFLKESKVKRRKEEVKYNRFQHLLSLRGFMALAFILVFIASFSMISFEATIPFFGKSKFNFGAIEMGWVFTLMGLVSVIIQGFFIGRLIEKFKEEKIIKAGLIISAIGYPLVIFSKNFFTFAIFICFASIGQGLIRPALTTLISKETEFEEGITMGTMHSIDSLGRIIGPIFGGVLFGINEQSTYISIGIINLLFWLIFFFA